MVRSSTPTVGSSLRRRVFDSLNLSVQAETSSDLLGKAASDLQSNIVVSDGKIKGTLKYVTGYTGFSGEEELQSGNYLAIKCDADDGSTLKAKLIGGQFGEVTLDSDKNVIIRITDKDTQKVQVRAIKGDKEQVEVFSLKELVCQTA